jgi:hypothetical protein
MGNYELLTGVLIGTGINPELVILTAFFGCAQSTLPIALLTLDSDVTGTRSYTIEIGVIENGCEGLSNWSSSVRGMSAV